MRKFIKAKFIVPILLVLIALLGLFIFDSFGGTPRVAKAPTMPDVQYDDERSDRMLLILKNRPALTPADKAIRDQLVTLPNPIASTSEFSMEYLLDTDQFKVEILTPNIDQAKTAAVAWLSEKGLSKNGICYLPVTFYLNYDVSESLRGQNITFDPIPKEC